MPNIFEKTRKKREEDAGLRKAPEKKPTKGGMTREEFFYPKKKSAPMKKSK